MTFNIMFAEESADQMTLFNFVPALIAFAVAVFAIAGKPKWDSSKRGVHRLTGMGWLVLCAAIATLCVSLIQTVHTHSAARIRQEQIDKVTTIAHTELRLAIHSIVWPFLDDYVILRSLGKKSDSTSTSYADMLTPEWRDTLALIDLRAASPYEPAKGPNPKWVTMFSEKAQIGSERLDRVLQTYAIYFDPDIIADVSALRNSEFLMRLVRLQDHVDVNDTSDDPIYFHQCSTKVPDDMFGYVEFWSILARLDERLIRDEDKLKRGL